MMLEARCGEPVGAELQPGGDSVVPHSCRSSQELKGLISLFRCRAPVLTMVTCPMWLKYRIWSSHVEDLLINPHVLI